MAHERMLTVMTPVKGDEEWIVELSAPPTLANTDEDVIYRYGGRLFRRFGDTIKIDIKEREFPELGKPLEIFDFQYDATRMGTAPVISASGVHWFENLDDLWTQECHVSFGGENYYLKQIPTSGKNNEDARYEYDMSFISERYVLETVYFYDVVTAFYSDKPVSENAKFSFFGTVKELAKRLNTSLVRSGLSRYREYSEEGGTYLAPTIREWNDAPVSGDDDLLDRYNHFHGDYSASMRGDTAYTQYVALDDDGEPIVDGYRVVVDYPDDELEEKFVAFDNDTIHSALQEVKDTWGLQYYIKSEKDQDGAFTGNTLIVIGDCEYDFGEEHPFSYGRDNELLSIEKTNTTEDIVTRCTGTGSTENIPHYYPNPTADGWIKPILMRDGQEVMMIGNVHQDIVEYAKEGDADYEKYLVNSIGTRYVFGRDLMLVSLGNSRFYTPYEFIDEWGRSGEYFAAMFSYAFNAPEFLADGSAPSLTIEYLPDEQIQSMTVIVKNSTTNTVISTFTLTETTVIPLVGGDTYSILFTVVTNIPYATDFPEYATWYNYEGYHYPYEEWTYPTSQANNAGHCAIDDFYAEDDADVLFGTYTLITLSGQDIYYHKRGRVDVSETDSVTTVYEPMQRYLGDRYIDKNTGTIYECLYDETYRVGSLFLANPRMKPSEYISAHCTLDTRIKDDTSWFLGAKPIDLADYGMSKRENFTPAYGDTIEFKRVKYLTPQQALMPEVYYRTDGERRFYNAVNYYRDGEADTATGEDYLYHQLTDEPTDWATTYNTYYRLVNGTYTLVDDAAAPTFSEGIFYERGRVKNNLYKKDDNSGYFDFENEFVQRLPREHIEQFEDIKPTIKGLVYNGHRIDVAAEYAYDEYDNDNIWQSGEDGTEGEYKHPHFFIKLRPLGFNLFDMALTEDMELSLTSGHCGSCTFKIKVDDKTKKNPVQVWEQDVYRLEGEDYVLDAHKGDLKRYRAYKLYTSAHIELSDKSYLISSDSNNTVTTVQIVDGRAGSIKKASSVKVEGDVITRGTFQHNTDIDGIDQQDTTEKGVWIALEKDTSTFGVLMPSVISNYVNGEISSTIRPVSVADTGDEDTADTFVLLNIRMPQLYIRNAEHELSRAIVEYMYEHNPQKFNFSIGFSRIYLADNEEVESQLNENSVLYVGYNNKVYKQYVAQYSYKMSHDAPLPEITVSMNEELSAVRNYASRERRAQMRMEQTIAERIDIGLNELGTSVARNYVSSHGDVVVPNLISQSGRVSVKDLRDFTLSTANTVNIENLTIKKNFQSIQTFAGRVSSVLEQMKTTIEYRIPNDVDGGCHVVVIGENTEESFWATTTGEFPTTSCVNISIPTLNIE